MEADGHAMGLIGVRPDASADWYRRCNAEYRNRNCPPKSARFGQFAHGIRPASDSAAHVPLD
jgi:hypothetical protein